MPRRDDIHKIMLLGSGPIVIGQAAEFDYSGVQACKVLREEGYELVLVNSNPATIMTDPEFADATYVEPLLPGPVAQIIEKERPDALLPTLGGQTALNLAKALHEDGTLERFGVELIGADYDAIERAEDRDLFRQTMDAAGLKMPASAIATTLDEAIASLDEVPLPVIVRPAFTLGGRGGGAAHTLEEFRAVAARGLAASPISQILIDQSVIGWGEFELEVMRDRNDNVVIVCSIENVDPMGVHTGDSVTVAPQQTLTDRLYQQLRDQAIACIRAVGVETGGSNVQFAVNPQTEEILVIEMNPRVSRSSALASKATGFPIAKIAARLAVGYALEEIPNDITQLTPASFEPTIDYVVVKWPRFAFEKFAGVDSELTTHMKSVGEAMAIGRTFGQAFLKAMRSRELDMTPKLDGVDVPTLLELLERPAPDRFDVLFAAFRAGASIDDVQARTSIDPWFLRELCAAGAGSGRGVRRRALVPGGGHVRGRVRRRDAVLLLRLGAPRSPRGPARRPPVGCDPRLGANRIGQGIEFDYCCVHAAMTVRESGRDAVMVNCNPETVSTDYDTSDRLYFEPLTLEDVLAVVEVEQPEGVIVQFGGQTPLKLAAGLVRGRRDVAGHQRRRDRPGRGSRPLRRPARPARLRGAAVRDGALGREALAAAPEVGFPLLVRPSYVLGGRAMEIVYSIDGLHDYLDADGAAATARSSWTASWRTPSRSTSTRCATARTSGSAGSCSTSRRPAIHSATAPARCRRTRSAPTCSRRSARTTEGIALGLGVVGLINVQYAVQRRRALRDRGQPARLGTVPFVSKAIGAPGQVGLPADAGREARRPRPAGRPDGDHVSVKEAVLPFDRFEGADAILGPEMRSTGEVMGVARDFPTAFAKAQAAAGAPLPQQGTVFITVTDSDKSGVHGIAGPLYDAGFRIVATAGTAQAVRSWACRASRSTRSPRARPTSST